MDDDPIVPRPNGFKETSFVRLIDLVNEPTFVTALPWMARAKARERL